MPIELPSIPDVTPPDDSSLSFGAPVQLPSHNDPAYIVTLTDEQFLALVPVLRSKFGQKGLAEAELVRRNLK